MKIYSSGSIDLNPKQVLKRKDDLYQLKINVSALLSDSVTFSNSIIKKAPGEISVNRKLTGFGEKFFNQPVLNHYLAFRNNLKYKPVIEKLDQEISNGIDIKELEKLSIKTTKEYNKNAKTTEVLEMAYNSILASTIEKKYSDQKFFNGEKDKIFHYFVSGAMTIKTYNNIPLLPSGTKAFIASKSILTLGWLKEVGSIPGNGYGTDDMQANRLGINAAIKYLKNLP